MENQEIKCPGCGNDDLKLIYINEARKKKPIEYHCDVCSKDFIAKDKEDDA